MSDDFEVVWNGTKSRNGECKSLTGYTGPSSLINAPQERVFTEGELYRVQVALGVRGRQPQRTRSEAQTARQARERNRKAAA